MGDGRSVAPLTALIEMARRTSAGSSSLPPIRERSSLSPDPEAEQELEHFLDSSNKVRHHLAVLLKRLKDWIFTETCKVLSNKVRGGHDRLSRFRGKSGLSPAQLLQHAVHHH